VAGAAEVRHYGLMARRGDALREHILWVAKGLFLELGFERASMDEVASRAQTSKRSVYAHFASKEKLFLAVIELVRGLFLSRIKEPAAYSAKPAEALEAFCARYLEAVLYESSVQLLRISMAETTRFPEGAAKHHDVVFTEVTARVSSHLKRSYGLSARASSEAAQRLIGRLLFPRLTRALFGLEDLIQEFDEHTLSPKVDVKAVRKAVTELLATLPTVNRSHSSA
jgi:AcrR family transcriptional regulator